MSMPISEATPERILLRLDWNVIRRLDGLLQGDYRTLFYGFGVDFADLREYQPEDDIRYIDWNVTARMDTPYVRQYLEDREVTAWFLLDLSPSVDFGTVTKSEADDAHRFCDGAGALIDSAREPRRGDDVWEQDPAYGPGKRRQDSGPASRQRYAPSTALCHTRRLRISHPFLMAR